MAKTRYFYASAGYKTGSGIYEITSFSGYKFFCDFMPSEEYTKEMLKAIVPEAREIVILSLSEWSKKDYDKFIPSE